MEACTCLISIDWPITSLLQGPGRRNLSQKVIDTFSSMYISVWYVCESVRTASLWGVFPSSVTITLWLRTSSVSPGPITVHRHYTSQSRCNLSPCLINTILQFPQSWRLCYLTSNAAVYPVLLQTCPWEDKSVSVPVPLLSSGITHHMIYPRTSKFGSVLQLYSIIFSFKVDTLS